MVARYGGEEFVVILPATGQSGACEVAERIRAAVEALEIPHEANPDAVVTVSIGVAAVTVVRQGTAAGLVEAADTALYRAKRAGRNQGAGDVVPVSAVVVPLLGAMRRVADGPDAPPRANEGRNEEQGAVVSLLHP